MKKITTIMIQVRTSDEEEWVTIGSRGSRYTDFTEAIREYDFNDFFYAVANERYYNWEHTYFKAKTNWFTGINRVVCVTKINLMIGFMVPMLKKMYSSILKSLESLEDHCKKINIQQDINNITLKALFEALPAKDFIEFVEDNKKKDIDITQN